MNACGLEQISQLQQIDSRTKASMLLSSDVQNKSSGLPTRQVWTYSSLPDLIATCKYWKARQSVSETWHLHYEIICSGMTIRFLVCFLCAQQVK